MKQLTENVMLMGNGFFNFYVVGQEEAALVECGTSAGAAIFAKQWEELAEKPQIKYIVALHSHFDHICGVSQLKQLFPEAKLVANSVAQKFLKKEKIVKMLFENDEIVTASYLKAGFIDEEPLKYGSTTIPVDLVVREGNILPLDGGLTLKFLDAPGHSPCSIAAYLEKDQVMLISDAAGFRADEKISPVFFQGYTSYLDTLNKLKGYPAQVVGVAHGAIPTGDEVDGFYSEAIKAAEEGMEMIQRRLQEGVREQELMKEMFGRYIKGPLAYYPPEMMMGSMTLLIQNVKSKLEAD